MASSMIASSNNGQISTCFPYKPDMSTEGTVSPTSPLSAEESVSTSSTDSPCKSDMSTEGTLSPTSPLSAEESVSTSSTDSPCKCDMSTEGTLSPTSPLSVQESVSTSSTDSPCKSDMSTEGTLSPTSPLSVQESVSTSSTDSPCKSDMSTEGTLSPRSPLSAEESVSTSSTDSPCKSDMSAEGAVSLPSTCSTEESFCSSSYSSFLDWEEFHTTFAMAEPMIEVHSIRIFKKSFADNHEEKCQVYGTIRVEDLKTNRPFFLYKKDVGDKHLDVISFLQRNLTLIGTDNVFSMEVPSTIFDIKDKATDAAIVVGTDNVFSMEVPSIIFDIRDKATDAAIVVGRACLENATTAEFEKDLTLTIELEGVGSACVDYTALRFGVAASLDFELYPDGDYGSDVASDNSPDRASDNASDSDEESVDVCGSILAYHSNGYCSRKSASQMACNKIFETKQSESQVVEFGSPIKLSRQFVAVPAYSSLVIQLNLRDPDTGEPIFVGQTVLEIDYWERSMEILGQSCRNYKMFLRVRWNEPFMLDESSYDSSLVEEDYFAKLPNGMLVFPQPLLEIFSVFIGRKHCEELNLYGTIQVFDSHLYCTVFEATEKDPYRLPSGCNTILLNGPSRVMYQGECFCILIDLMDVKQRIYIKGTASSSDGLKMGHMAWQDRWLSTIVKGAQEDGFAAVNYMAMPYAIKSLVKVHFLSQGRPDCLYGKIVAFYSAYDYTTDDDREYYRSVLFQRSEDNCFMPNGDNTEVKLSRSVFPVPLRSLLYIQMQLKFGIERGSIDKIVSFKPWQNDSFFDINANSFAIRVSVKWS